MPFIEKQLGIDEYGLWMLIGTFIGYIAILDLGLGGTVVRFIAKFRAEKDSKGEANFLANTYIIYGFISSIVLIIGLVCYYNIDHIFPNLRADQLERAKIMFAIFLFNLVIVLPCSTFGAICKAYEHFVFPKSVRIVRYVIRSITVVAVLLLGGKAIALVIIDSLMSLSVAFTNGRYCFTKLNIKVKLYKFDKKLLYEIFSYSIWIFVGVVATKFQWSSGQVILGITSTTAIVAIFGVGVVLGTYYTAFSDAVTNLFLPRAMQMTIRRSSSMEDTDLMIRIGRISMIMLMWILCGFSLFGKQFVQLWMSPEYVDSYYIALAIMVVYTIPLIENFADSILKARNKVKFKAVTFLICIIIGMGIGYWLSIVIGVYGMLIGLISGWVSAEIALNIYYYRVLKLEMSRFFKEVFNKIVLCTIVAFSIGCLIHFIPGNGWLNLFIKIASFTIVYFLIMYRYGTITYEKNLFQGSYESVVEAVSTYKNKIIK